MNYTVQLHRIPILHWPIIFSCFASFPSLDNMEFYFKYFIFLISIWTTSHFLISEHFKLISNPLFNTPKPVNLYKEIIKMAISPKEKNPVILDFFAGSGTVGQAVLQEFQGKDAQFVLCNSNENNICKEITYERIKRIIKGYKNQKGYNVKGIDCNLKYYTVKYIDKCNNENDGYYIVNELSNYLKELVQLEHGIDIDKSDKIKLLFTDEDVDNFACNDDAIKKCKIIYLYNNVLITEEQIEKFEENNIELRYVPDCYFEEELMEVEQW